MTQLQKNTQEEFLNYVKKSKDFVTVFLTNGVKLSGRVTWNDNYCITLTRDHVTQLVYKHAIATIMPTEPFSIYDVLGIENVGNE